MAQGIVIAGLPSSDKVPGAYGEVIYGAGSISAGSIPLTLLLVGLASSGATATPDVSLVNIFSSSDAVTAFGARGQVTRMCLKALQIAGINIKAMSVTPASGGAAATLTITVTGPATSAGTYNFRIGGESFSIGIATGDSATTIGDNIVAEINSNANMFCTAANSTGTVTCTVAFVGATGNQYYAVGDTSQLATGVGITITGGTAVTGGVVPFTGGSGVENITAALATLFPTNFSRIAAGQNDATNLGKWKTQINAQAVPTEGRRQHFVAAVNDVYATAQSRAQTTLNAARFQIAWQLYGESHPSETAATLAATRIQGEQSDPDAAFDDAILAGIAPQSQQADWPTHSVLVTALNNGVTPLYSTLSDARVCRSITTHSLNGSTPDYRTLDTNEAIVPDYVLLDSILTWTTSFKPANPRVRDNPAPEEQPVPPGVATPDNWNRVQTARLRAFERGDGLPAPIIINVSENLPISSFDSVADRIMCAVPVVPAPNQHQIGISVRQLNT